VAAEVTKLKSRWKQGLVQSLLTSAATFFNWLLASSRSDG